MRITCNTIRDLLPLYIEEMASDDSREIIDAHLDECEACKSNLEEMNAFSEFPIDTDTTPFLKLKTTLRKKKHQTVIFSMMIALAFGVLVLAILTAPEYIPYNKEIITINEIGNESVLVQFGEKVSAYDLNRYPTEDSNSYVYHVTTWDSIWNRNIAKTHLDDVVLNPAGEAIASVYYYETDGSEDILIYGENQNPSGGVMTLPRLFLAYYTLIALGLAVVCTFIIILFRRHKKVTDLTIKILFLPVSYLIGQFLIKGLKTSSYGALRDFYAILLIMVPLYIAFLIAHNIYKTYKKKWANEELSV